MATWIWIIIIIAVAIVVALVATAGARKSRTAALRRQFGPEYDRTLKATEDQQVAEAALRERQRQRARLDIKPIPEASRVRFAEEWRGIQERFVDSPSDAVTSAGALLREVMGERGYPREDPSAQADLLSVDYPEVIEDYRAAQGVQQRTQLQQASTEDLREALVKYRRLFEALLQVEPTPDTAAAVADGEAHDTEEREADRAAAAGGTAAEANGAAPADVTVPDATAERGESVRTGVRGTDETETSDDAS